MRMPLVSGDVQHIAPEVGNWVAKSHAKFTHGSLESVATQKN